MKRVIPISITVTMLVFTVISVILIYSTSDENKGVTVLYNEIVKTVEKNKEETIVFDVNYLVIYNDGTIKYANYEYKKFSSFDEYINFAYQNNDVILDFSLGKIIIEKTNDNTIKKLAYIIICYSLMMIFLMCLYSIYLKRKIFSPFNKLKNFASEVALGNLDSPMFMYKDNAFGAFTESFDIMRCELKKAKEREVALEKAKKELVVSLSHDIKTPIASIKAVSEVLTLTEKDPKKLKNLEIITRKTNEIDALITDMFNVTLQDLSELKITPVMVSSKELENIIIEADFLQLIETVKMPECLILADKLRLKQIIGNIINNSYKYANTRIKVDAKISNRYLCIEFIDYGDGVNEEELPLLTSKFYRGSNAEKQSGAGLGLYICKIILEKINGTIECYNSEGGFSVKVLLMLA